MSTTQTPQHIQRFTSTQKKFLEKMLLQFCAYTAGLHGTGPRGIGGVKGDQKDWIRKQVFEPFVNEFGNDEENKDELFNVRSLIFIDVELITSAENI